jgi:3-deoxy-manno-octulosonate cytidylyltransferase (CMP-KDO synthetase)
MGFVVIIPARMQSSRLPGKPLLDIGGRPMLQHVHEKALSSGAERVVIATDDERIGSAARGWGAQVAMTDPAHRSGTERLAEVVEHLRLPPDRVVVNLQGDEPLMPPALVTQVANALAGHGEARMATLCHRIHTAAELFDPHVVKVITDARGFALYFSRAAIPWDRDAFAISTEELPQRAEHFRHIGLYAYRAGFLPEYVAWPASTLEEMESLEQLRVLYHGVRIFVAEAAELPGHGVDTADDLARVRAAFSA